MSRPPGDSSPQGLDSRKHRRKEEPEEQPSGDMGPTFPCLEVKVRTKEDTDTSDS